MPNVTLAWTFRYTVKKKKSVKFTGKTLAAYQSFPLKNMVATF